MRTTVFARRRFLFDDSIDFASWKKSSIDVNSWLIEKNNAALFIDSSKKKNEKKNVNEKKKNRDVFERFRHVCWRVKIRMYCDNLRLDFLQKMIRVKKKKNSKLKLFSWILIFLIFMFSIRIMIVVFVVILIDRLSEILWLKTFVMIWFSLMHVISIILRLRNFDVNWMMISMNFSINVEIMCVIAMMIAFRNC